MKGKRSPAHRWPGLRSYFTGAFNYEARRCRSRFSLSSSSFWPPFFCCPGWLLCWPPWPFLAGLSGLVAVLSRLSALLTRLSALLFVFFHIVCHEIVLPFQCATWRILRFKSTAFN